MADKIYQVWRKGIDDTMICFASTDYDTTINYVVSIIISCEENRIADFIFRVKENEDKIVALNAQISVLEGIADNVAVKPILDDLIKKQKIATMYANMYSKTDTTVYTADYYKENLNKYCEQYSIGIFDFDIDTEFDIGVDYLLDKTAHYE